MTKHRLVAVVSPKGYTSFYLHIRYNGDITSMNEGSILLLKLGNGTNMELRSNKVEPDDFIHVETGLGSTNFLTVRYSITEDQIQQIIDNDVVKVRIQWTGGIFDKEIKNEECLSIF